MPPQTKVKDDHILTPKKITHGLTLHSPTVRIHARGHAKRIEEAIKTFQSECISPTDTVLSSFIYHYFTCEVLAKLIQGAKHGTTPSQALDKKAYIDLNALRAALNKHSIKFDVSRLDRIFLSRPRQGEKPSARNLRNKIAHELNANAIQDVKKRGRSLIRDMNHFIKEAIEASDTNFPL